MLSTVFRGLGFTIMLGASAQFANVSLDHGQKLLDGYKLLTAYQRPSSAALLNAHLHNAAPNSLLATGLLPAGMQPSPGAAQLEAIASAVGDRK